MRSLATALCLFTLACSAEPPPLAPPPAVEAPAIPATPADLPRPNVVMEADPPPDLTYWAPEGSVIRNHPHVPGMYYAYLNGVQVASYRGDACHASAYQSFVGQDVASLPAPPEGVMWRVACTTCPVTDDARPDRMNIVFDEATQRVTTVACY